MARTKAMLDPFRAILALVGDSDLLMTVANAAGLVFNASLTDREAHSNLTRVRALQPRILAAYDRLGEQEKLAAARAAISCLSPGAGDITASLERIGWTILDGELVVRDPDVREMFFPKGSQWDAYAMVQELFRKAERHLIVIDPYADSTIFHLLSSRPRTGLTVRILCSRHVDAVAAEARRFTEQHQGVKIEVRRTQDFHDRFLVLDEELCVHLGHSIKDAGNRACMISEVKDETNSQALLDAFEDAWTQATPL